MVVELSYGMEEKRTATSWIKANAAKMAEMSDKIFRWAEPGLREFKSSRLLADYLRQQGFTVDENVAGMPTAFAAKWGTVGPTIGFFAEYDATPGHSQKPVPWEEPEVPYGPGFTDAHNMLGVASCFAASAVKEASEQHGLPAKIRLFGTPRSSVSGSRSWLEQGCLTGWTLFSLGIQAVQQQSSEKTGP